MKPLVNSGPIPISPEKTAGNPGHLTMHNDRGFTIIELVMVIVVLGIVAAIAIPRMGGLSESSRINATKSEILMLKKAIVGNSSVAVGGQYIDVGFEGNIGHPPASLVELGIKSDSLPTYDKFTRLGWNGPYVDTAGDDYLTDAWGVAYIYDGVTRTITSVGGSDTISVSF
jgi:prepilin-type N-terminal cleavage/methylation domain-containing protein